MKLSAHALQFLLAHYRAIFKRAYISGLAGAVLLSAGLASSASAEVYLSTQGFTKTWNSQLKLYELVTSESDYSGGKVNIDHMMDVIAGAASGNFESVQSGDVALIKTGMLHYDGKLPEGNLNFLNAMGAINWDGREASGGNLVIGGANGDIKGNIIRSHFSGSGESGEYGGSAFGGLALASGASSATNNTLTVQGDNYADAAVVGGYALSTTGNATSSGNILNYTSSQVVQGIDTSGVAKTLAGGYARSNSNTGSITVTGNTLNLGSAASATALDLSAKETYAGGFGRLHSGSGSISITENVANITNVLLNTSGDKYLVGGGTDKKATTSATISDNELHLTDATITGDKVIIAGGYTKEEISMLVAAGNQVYVDADSVITDASIYSTYSNNGYYASEQDGLIKLNGTYNVSAEKIKTLAATTINVGGTIKNAGTLTVQGEMLATSGAHIENTGSLTLTKEANWNDADVVTNTGTITLEDTGLRLNTLSDLLAAEGAKIELKNGGYIALDVEDTVDLTSNKISLSGDGQFNFDAEEATVTIGANSSGFYRVGARNVIAKTEEASNGTYTIGANKVLCVMESFDLTSKDTSGNKTVTVSGSLLLGSNEEYVGGTEYEITYSEGGTLNGVSVKLNADQAKLDFDHGAWRNVGTVTVSKGQMSVAEGASAALTGLSATTAGSVNVTAGSLSANTLDMDGAASGTVSLSTDAQFTTALDQVITYTDGKVAVDSGSFATGAITLDGSSTLYLTGAEALLGSDTIKVTDFAAIKKAILGESGMGTVSFDSVNVGLDPEVEQSGQISADAAAEYAGSDALKNTTVTGVTSVPTGTHTWGSAKLSDSTTSLTVSDGSVLNLTGASGGTFVKDASGNAAPISVSGENSQVALKNGGMVGAITGNSSSGQGLLVAGNGQATTVGTISKLESVTLQGGAVSVGAISDVEKLTVQSSPISAGGDIEVVSLTLDSALTSELSDPEDAESARHNVTAEVLTMEQGAVLTTNTLTLGATSNLGSESTLQGTVVAEHIEVAKAGSNTIAIRDAEVMAQSLTFTGDDGVLTVGWAQTEDEDSAGGSLELESLNLNGGMLLLDPNYGTRAAVTAVTGTETSDVITTQGNVAIGQNSVFVSGLSEDEGRALLDKLGLTNDVGSLDKNNVGSALVLNRSYEIAKGHVLYLDPAGVVTDDTSDPNSLSEHVSTMTTALKGSGGAVELQGHSALVVTSDLTERARTDSYLLHFADSGTASVTLGQDSRIIFDSMALVAQDSVLFTNTTQVTDNGVDITAAGGLLTGTITDGATNDKTITFSFNPLATKLITAQSAPVKAKTLEVLKNEDGSYDSADLGVGFIAATGAVNGGRDTEVAARLALYGGAAQAALQAQDSTNEAIAARLGYGLSEGLVSADNSQGAGLWVAPFYRNQDSDGFEAQGMNYGADLDLYGVALGADITLASQVRLGAAFSLGSGDADGQGMGTGISNDFDFFGFSLYAGTSFNGFNFSADLGYSQVSNDLEYQAHLGKLSTDPDAQILTLGLRGEYLLQGSVLDATPHVGLRYTSLDLDDYEVKCDGDTIARTDADRMNIFSLPVGVTLGRTFENGAWKVTPQFDLTVSANFGDDEMDSATTFVGVESIALSQEVLDNFTYGARLGLAAQFQENFSVGLNVGYVGSSNSDSFGVNAQARYSF